MCARIGRDVAPGEQARPGNDGAGGDLEPLEVDLVGMGDEHCVDVLAVAAVDEVNAGLLEERPCGLGRERQDTRLSPKRSRYACTEQSGVRTCSSPTGNPTARSSRANAAGAR